jgi:hypothetical protein
MMQYGLRMYNNLNKWHQPISSKLVKSVKGWIITIYNDDGSTSRHEHYSSNKPTRMAKELANGRKYEITESHS